MTPGVLQGFTKRIGTSENTSIWEHNWIPRVGFKRPLTSLVLNPPRRVSDLIDATSASWREELVRTTFMAFDAEAILKIPLCSRHIDDF